MRALRLATCSAALSLVACSSTPPSVLSRPTGVAVGATGIIYVADAEYNVLWAISPGGAVNALAGTSGRTGSLDGTGAAAQFNAPSGVAVDASGNIFVADYGNDTIRKVTPQGVVSTFAGTAGQAGSVDDTGPAARFNHPWGIAVVTASGAAQGTLYVADAGNNTIRAITPAGAVTTIAGTAGQPGSADGAGLAASFDFPAGVALDSAGNLYVADFVNDTVREITFPTPSAAVVTTVAGTPGQPGSVDGIGPAALFHSPAGVAVDSSGNVFVADSLNDCIREIMPGGVVSPFAGAAGQPGNSDGQGSAALFNRPYGIAVNASGDLYVADTINSLIRMVTPTGLVTTINTNGG